MKKLSLFLILVVVQYALSLAELVVLSAAEKKSLVDNLNAWRKLLSPPASNIQIITWSDEIAKFSQSWASKCQYGHSTQADKNAVVPPVNGVPVLTGENIAWRGSTSTVFPAGNLSIVDAQNRWRAESANYNYNANTCSGVCGHYLMEAWASATKVGCAVARCKPLMIGGVWKSDYNYQYVICNYDKIPITGQRPYIASGSTPAPTTVKPTATPTTVKPTATPTTVVTSTVAPDAFVQIIVSAINSFRVSKGQTSLVVDSLLTTLSQKLLTSGTFDFATSGTKFKYTKTYTFFPRIASTVSSLLTETGFTSQLLDPAGYKLSHQGVSCANYDATFKKCSFALAQSFTTVLEETEDDLVEE